jgi:hypothetical protein
MKQVAAWLLAVAAAVLVPAEIARASGDGMALSLPQAEGSWSVASDERASAPPSEPGTLEIRGVGRFTFDPSTIATLRPDVFVAGHLSAFDVLAAVAASGAFDLTYAYDEAQASFVIETINGLAGWWYDVKLPGGAFERTALRMDAYPIRGGSEIYVYLEDEARLAAIHEGFRDEVALRDSNGGAVVVPIVTIKGPRATASFENVTVTAHGARRDVFQPGVITALDVLLSLGQQGRLSGIDLTWHESLGEILGVTHYMVDWISHPTMLGEPDAACGYMDQSATEVVRAFLTPHSHSVTEIHLSPDLEPLVSPGFVEWQWLCATS